jgi:hypothetical protein
MVKQSVTAFLMAMPHSRKAEIERLRELIFEAEPTLREQIKWNAPSYGLGDDRITFRLQPGDKVDLIFHRGAKVQDSTGFVFEDESGLLKWLGADRALVSFSSAAEVDANAKPFKHLVKRWITATA